MKKFYFLAAALVFAFNLSFAQTGWVDYKIDNRISSKLPTTPTSLMEGTVMALTADSTAFIITKVDYKAAAQLDSAALAPLLGTAEFASGLRTGMLRQMAGFTLSQTKTSKVQGQYAYSLDGVNEGQKLKSYTLMIVIGQYLYAFTALVKDGHDTKHRDEFFASIHIK